METGPNMLGQIEPAEPAPDANILTRLISGAVDALDCDRASTRMLLQQAIAILQRVDSAKPSIEPALRPTSLAPWQAKRVAGYITAHLDRPIALRELAEVAHLSCSHFSRAFKGAF